MSKLVLMTLLHIMTVSSYLNIYHHLPRLENQGGETALNPLVNAV